MSSGNEKTTMHEEMLCRVTNKKKKSSAKEIVDVMKRMVVEIQELQKVAAGH